MGAHRSENARSLEVVSDIEDDLEVDDHASLEEVEEQPILRARKRPRGERHRTHLTSKSDRRPSVVMKAAGGEADREDEVRRTKEAAMKAFGLVRSRAQAEQQPKDIEAEAKRRALEAFNLIR